MKVVPDPSSLQTAPFDSEDDGFRVRTSSLGGAASLVFLIGYAGCQWKHLGHYYEDLIEAREDLHCIMWLTTMGDMFDESLPARALDLVRRRRWEQCPSMVYCFSDGGAGHAAWLLQLGEHDQRYAFLRDSLRGMLFDSSPSQLKTRGGFRAFWNHRFLRKYVVGCCPCFVTVIACYFLTIRKRRRQRLDILDHSSWPVRVAVVGCVDDRVCPVADLELFMKRKRSAGVAVESLMFEHSRHARAVSCRLLSRGRLALTLRLSACRLFFRQVHHISPKYGHKEEYLAWCADRLAEMLPP